MARKLRNGHQRLAKYVIKLSWGIVSIVTMATMSIFFRIKSVTKVFSIFINMALWSLKVMQSLQLRMRFAFTFIWHFCLVNVDTCNHIIICQV